MMEDEQEDEDALSDGGDYDHRRLNVHKQFELLDDDYTAVLLPNENYTEDEDPMTPNVALQ